MDSGMISKIQKARQYAMEPERISFEQFQAVFRGEHGTYQVLFDRGKWQCSCHFFASHGVCSHTMALERVLEPMLDSVQEGV